MLKIVRPVSFVLLSAAFCSGGVVHASDRAAITPRVGISQQEGSLKGTVSDSFGPVAGASIVAKICYWNSESVDEIVDVINRSLFPKFDCEINLEKLKDRIVYTLVNANSNKSRLKTITYRMLEGTDLAITYKLII